MRRHLKRRLSWDCTYRVLRENTSNILRRRSHSSSAPNLNYCAFCIYYNILVLRVYLYGYIGTHIIYISNKISVQNRYLWPLNIKNLIISNRYSRSNVYIEYRYIHIKIVEFRRIYTSTDRYIETQWIEYLVHFNIKYYVVGQCQTHSLSRGIYRHQTTMSP